MTYPGSSVSGFAPAEMYDKNNSDYRHMHGVVIKKENLVDGNHSYKEINKHQKLNGDILITEGRYFPTGSSDSISVLYQYNIYGNIVQVNKTNDMPIAYIWGYNNVLPVAKIDNGTKSSLDAIFGTNFNTGAGSLNSTQENSLRNASSLASSLISTYTYSPTIGITTITDPSNITTTYNYDSAGRLELIKDYNSDILKRYAYNYASYLTVSTNQVNAPYTAGNVNASIGSNKPWSDSDNAAWINISPGSGISDAIITISYDQNLTTSQRSGTITVSGGQLSQNITVTQAASPPFITINPSSLYFTSTGTKTTNVSASVNWARTITYYSGSNWLMINPSSGTGNQSVSVIVTTAPPSGSWSANVKLSDGTTNEYLFVEITH